MDGPRARARPTATAHGGGAVGREPLVGLGVAGGLVPSPAALLVLLAAVGLAARSVASAG